MHINTSVIRLRVFIDFYFEDYFDIKYLEMCCCVGDVCLCVM